MYSDAIEGEPSHLGVNSIFPPSMPTLKASPESISQPILDPDDLSHALSLKSHDDLKTPRKQPHHRSHKDYKDARVELRQWLECIRN